MRSVEMVYLVTVYPHLPGPGPMSSLLTIDDPRRVTGDQGPQGVWRAHRGK